VERGTLLSVKAKIQFWRGQFDQLLSPGLESVSLLAAGSKPWCRVFEALLPAMGLVQPSGLPPLLAQFTTVQPAPEARATYVHAATWASVVVGIAGQKEVSLLLLERVRQVGASLMDMDLHLRAHVRAAEASFFHHIRGLPYQHLLAQRDATRAFQEVGNRPPQVIVGAHEGNALLDLGQRAAAREVLAANMALAEQLNDEMPLAYARVYTAHLCASSKDPADWDVAERHAGKLQAIQNLTMLAQARLILAKIKWNRGDLTAAAAEAHAACDLLRSFPTYRPQAVALWSRILAAQNRTAESLHVCEEGFAQNESLGFEGSGLLDLYAALADAYIRCGQPASARPIIERAVSILRLRADDIPDPAMRATYLHEVPENAHLLELAAPRTGVVLADDRNSAL
jgi:tetratricopeptide (TPR) repeat protein